MGSDKFLEFENIIHLKMSPCMLLKFKNSIEISINTHILALKTHVMDN